MLTEQDFTAWVARAGLSVGSTSYDRAHSQFRAIAAGWRRAQQRYWPLSQQKDGRHDSVRKPSRRASCDL